MGRSTTVPRWPLWLWSLQLAPAGFLIVYAAWRLTAGFGAPSGELKSIVALGAGGTWFASALGMLLNSRARQWLVHQRKGWCLSAVTLTICLVLNRLQIQ